MRLERLDDNRQPAGCVIEPSEAVNHVDTHGNRTLFDIDA